MPLLRDSARAISLAACQSSASGPTPTAIAVRLAVDVAAALEVAGARHGVTPAQISIGYDGAVGIVPVQGREETAYLAPEQVIGSALDRRADVFSLGVVIWELLTGARLFARATEALTKVAILKEPILDPRAVTREIPAILAEVLTTALARDRNGRFDTAMAFARALNAARATAGIAEAGADDLARWVSARVPPALPQLGGPVPDLDLPSMPSSRRSLSTRTASPAVPPTSVRTAAAVAFSEASLSIPAHRAIAFDLAPDDDFDMQIERNLTTSVVPTATSSRPSGTHSGRPSTPNKAGLELGAPLRRNARTEPSARRSEVGFLAKLLGYLVAMGLLGGTSAALWRFVHRAGGRSLSAPLPHAFDGLSATDSGAVALVALMVAVTVIFLGLRLKPHAWLVVLSGGTLLVLALAMVTVTLASTGDNPTPPDGVLLVPFLAPAALLLLALGMAGRAGRLMAHASGAGRLGGVPIAVIAGTLAFVAFEVSCLSAR